MVEGIENGMDYVFEKDRAEMQKELVIDEAEEELIEQQVIIGLNGGVNEGSDICK